MSVSCEHLCEAPFPYCVEQGGTAEYHAFLKRRDEDGNLVPVLKSELDDITLRITNQEDGEIINERDEISVLDINGGSFDVDSGELIMIFGSDDHPITEAGSELRRETHVATFFATWGNGAGSKRWLVIQEVDNLDNIAGVAPEA